MAGDDLRISPKDIRALEEVKAGLDEIQGRLSLNAIGDVIGDVEGAVSLILENIDALSRFLQLQEPEREAFKQTVETVQGVLSGAERGLRAGAQLSALLPLDAIPVAGPLVESALTAGLGLAGGALGGEIASGQGERRRQLEQGLIRAENLEASQDEALRQQLEDREARIAAELEDRRRRAATSRALGGGS